MVCAAVSALFRTAARVLKLQPDMVVRGSASEDGRMELLLDRVPPARRQWLEGVTDFLVRGVRDLQEENPEAISVRVTER